MDPLWMSKVIDPRDMPTWWFYTSAVLVPVVVIGALVVLA